MQLDVLKLSWKVSYFVVVLGDDIVYTDEVKGELPATKQLMHKYSEIKRWKHPRGAGSTRKRCKQIWNNKTFKKNR